MTSDHTSDATEQSVPAPALFCSTCGHPRSPQGGECQVCARARLVRDVAKDADEREGLPVRRALVLYFLLLGVSIAGVIAGRVLQGSHLAIEWVWAGSHTVIVVATLGLTFRRLGPILSRVGHPGWYALAGLGGLVTCVGAHLAMRWLTSVLHVPLSPLSTPILEAGYGWMVVVLTIAVQPAIVEELAFRGIIQPAMATVMPWGAAVAVSSLMFMVLHMTPLSFPHLLAIGVALGLLRHFSGSVYPGMVLHFVHNLGVVLIEQFGGHAL